jgi:hypothetical protein
MNLGASKTHSSFVQAYPCAEIKKRRYLVKQDQHLSTMSLTETDVLSHYYFSPSYTLLKKHVLPKT